jgi:cystathionine beta-lyase/cystathionine gamma-synthase
MKFSTKAVHVGQEPEETTGAVVHPVFLTSTYVQEAPGDFKGYDYTRAGNPNYTRLEQALAALEGGAHATVFSSGLGALTAILSTLESGAKIVAVDDLYGGSYRLFTRVFERFGVEPSFVPMQDLDAVDRALAAAPAMVFIETPTNPLLKIVDIAVVAEKARSVGALSVVDNTFASPYFQNPLALGADVVWHSSTKYIGGHSDVIGGAVICNDAELSQAMSFARMAIGLNPSPFDAWLLSRSIKTLAVRMQRHAENAAAIVEFLSSHPRVEKVYYPGLESHAGHAIAREQMSGFSGIVSAQFDLPIERTKRFISSLRVFTLAESLGGVESLVDHPATMTHASIPAAEREKVGLTDGLVRFSVGIEDAEDLIADLDAGLNE